jgi:hypothetical protein
MAVRSPHGTEHGHIDCKWILLRQFLRRRQGEKGARTASIDDPGSVDGNNNSPRADNPTVVFGAR